MSTVRFEHGLKMASLSSTCVIAFDTIRLTTANVPEMRKRGVIEGEREGGRGGRERERKRRERGIEGGRE